MSGSRTPATVSPSALADVGPLLDALRGVQWPAQGRLAAGPPGVHHSRRRSTGSELTEYRPYRQGDDPRRLDWKLLARTDRAFVRITDDHAIWPTMLIVDASASMAFPTDGRTKWQVARALALGLASVAHAGGDPVGLMVASGDELARFPPTTRRDTVAALAAVLGTVAPRGVAHLGRCLARAGTFTRGRSGRVVVIGDFLDPDVPALVRAARTSDGEWYAIHLVARAELDPPTDAQVVSDPEDPTVRRTWTSRTRAAYDDAFRAWRAGLQAEWLAAGASFLLATTDDPADRLVRRVTRLAFDRTVPAIR